VVDRPPSQIFFSRRQALLLTVGGGAFVSFVLIMYVFLEGPGAWLVQWVALVPVLLGLLSLGQMWLAHTAQADTQLAERVKELEILSRIDRELNYTLSVNRILNLAVDWVLRFTNSDAAAIALVDERAGMLQYISGYGYPPQSWERLSRELWPISQGIAGRVARTGLPENMPDIAQGSDYTEVLPGTQSLLVIPITRQGRVIAVIRCESRTPSAFSADNQEFAVRLASRAAAAIDNANLLDAVERERQKLEVILASTVDAVIVVDHEGQLVLVNQAALAAFRLPPREKYAGQAFADVFGESDLAAMLDQARATGQGPIGELALPEGRTMHARIVHVPEVGWSIVMHDITPFKETDKLKNELLATTSHDLKNPLSTILGYVDLVQMTNQLNAQGQTYVRRVHGAVAHMRHLIDDLLDMARIESGITLAYAEVNLAALVDSIASPFMPLLREKGLTLSIDIPPDMPAIFADEGRLTQILTNLLSNAIKYTPSRGNVWVAAETLNHMARIMVRDDGLGMSPEDQAHVFQRFFRVRTPETDGIEGTGLGLAIVKSLVEAHGGQVGLESRLGEGSTFTVTLPLDSRRK
jgi:two-component system phosphate regulon sensor histidine kinase PhoR